MRDAAVLLCVTFLLWRTHPVAAATCVIDDLQSCSSCPQLEGVVDYAHPDKGQYYRGAFWNGLFAAYRLNCLDIGKRLLDHKANANLGGVSGSFLATVVQAWPHNNEAVNAKWANLLMTYATDINWKNPWTDESAAEIVAHNEITVAYPNLWKQISQK